VKLLFENWRRYLIERSLEPIEDDEIEDVVYGLSFSGVRKHLSNHFGKAKITVTNSPLDLKRGYDPNDNEGFKPDGLWYGCGTAWLNFIEREMPHRITPPPGPGETGSQIWALKIDMSMIKSLIDPDEIENFTRKYRDIERYINTMVKTPDWIQVAQEYSGIECCPYPVGDWEFRMKYMWYYTIDMSSGCIWDTSAITNSMLVAELKEDGWEVYV